MLGCSSYYRVMSIPTPRKLNKIASIVAAQKQFEEELNNVVKFMTDTAENGETRIEYIFMSNVPQSTYRKIAEKLLYKGYYVEIVKGKKLIVSWVAANTKVLIRCESDACSHEPSSLS